MLQISKCIAIREKYRLVSILARVCIEIYWMAQNMDCFIVATKHHDQGSLQKKVLTLSYSFRRLESMSDGAKA